MNTRKNRKRTWKVQEQEFETSSGDAVSASSPTRTSTNTTPPPAVAKKAIGTSQQQDSNRLLLFLQSWQEAKEAQVNGTLRKDMPESIVDLMSAKGYPISVNLARTKIMNFIKKYNLVKKMAAHGKPNEWTHFNTVKKILEFGPPILPTANVAIPLENIKSEEKASLKAENTLKIAERKVSIDAQTKSGTSTKSTKDIDLIEIGDDDMHLLKPRVYFSESEHIDESDDSEMSDDELDFENPLDKISFGFQNASSTSTSMENGRKDPLPKMPKLEKGASSSQKMPILSKMEQNHIKIPNVGANAVRPSLLTPSHQQQQRIIPLSQNVKLPNSGAGAPQQFLIVRPLTPGNGKTLAIPMGGEFKFGNAPKKAENKSEASPSSSSQVKIVGLPKMPAQLMMPNIQAGSNVDIKPPPPPLVCTNATKAKSDVNGQVSVSSPCSSPNSSNAHQSPTMRQLLTNVINLETNIYKLQQERLQLERERFEMERDYGKEMLNVFREIKDKLCDIISVPTSSTSPATSTKATTNNSEVDKE
ncbi:uncharacterized protein LOC134838493 [Culicoides brevitarsis]|uniref:uncharacterized protein LOC134838493 n=1 Tax=Culicoides brevitarsis TaxID=469753 RepID=UPI00307B9C27